MKDLSTKENPFWKEKLSQEDFQIIDKAYIYPFFIGDSLEALLILFAEEHPLEEEDLLFIQNIGEIFFFYQKEKLLSPKSFLFYEKIFSLYQEKYASFFVLLIKLENALLLEEIFSSSRIENFFTSLVSTIKSFLSQGEIFQPLPYYILIFSPLKEEIEKTLNILEEKSSTFSSKEIAPLFRKKEYIYPKEKIPFLKFLSAFL